MCGDCKEFSYFFYDSPTWQLGLVLSFLFRRPYYLYLSHNFIFPLCKVFLILVYNLHCSILHLFCNNSYENTYKCI